MAFHADRVRLSGDLGSGGQKLRSVYGRLGVAVRISRATDSTFATDFLTPRFLAAVYRPPVLLRLAREKPAVYKPPRQLLPAREQNRSECFHTWAIADKEVLRVPAMLQQRRIDVFMGTCVDSHASDVLKAEIHV